MRQWRLERLLWGMVIALTVLAVAACGAAAQGGGGTMNPTSTTGPTQGVVVDVGKPTYTTTDAIAVTVHNALGSDIVAPDHQTSCTIVQLQIESGGAWQNQGGCALGMATRQVTIAAGSAMSVNVDPAAGQIKVKPWPAGSYRVAFTYRIGSIATPGPSETVYSPVFTVS